MKVLFFLGHPAHFHLFKNPIRLLKANGHEILIVMKEKDILGDLLTNEGYIFENILPVANKKRSRNKASILFFSGMDLLRKDLKLLSYVKRNKPDLLLGTEVAITHIGKLLGIPSVVLNEDDYAINPEFCLLSYPFADHIISPATCNVGNWNEKKISYDGFQKLAYLHPKYFTPGKEFIRGFNPNYERYFLLRFVSFTASHDIWLNNPGMSLPVAKRIVDILEPHGRIFITSEGRLDDSLEKYRLRMNPNHIHHALAFADLLICDSQSMSVESAILGTPVIRFNDWAGRTYGVFDDLEGTYGLTCSIKTSAPEKVFSKLEEFLSDPDLKKVFHQRRDKMISEKIDLTSFLTWFIEEYPISAKRVAMEPGIQLGFK